MPAPAKVALQRWGFAAWDAISWVLATIAVVAARYDFALQPRDQRVVALYAAGAVALMLIGGFATKLYRGRHQTGSFDEAITLSLLIIGIGLGLGLFYLIFGGVGYPRGILPYAPLGALALATAGRFLARSITSAQTSRSSAEEAKDVLVYGAGNAGLQLARLVNNDPDAPYRIAGFIDDDPGKRNLHVGGSRVLGGMADLVQAADATGVKTVIMAIPTAPSQLLRDVSKITDREGLNLLVMPAVRDIVGGKVSLAQLHQIDVADLLGRTPIKTDLAEIAGYVSGKVVLVTGAGGSIGAEISRQVHRFGPKELVMLDRDESGLHSTQLSIFKQGLLDTPNMVLCDIRDDEALDKIFAAHRPDVVFHAAALKHLPMLQQYPGEGWKTNVLGSENVLKAARKYGVKRYVNISTDKAADASSILGKTKRIAEELTAWYAQQTNETYLSVRFGNVLGSRGSMLYTFTSQIEAGGPLTVTHPDITRYFMTIPEACELVIQAGAIGEPGDVLVLDMGQPVKILEVAKGLIARSGKDISIIFTGLRDGEKLHEVLFSGDEEYTPTTHPLIRRVSVPPLDPDQIAGIHPEDVASLDRLTSQEAAGRVPAGPEAAALPSVTADDHAS